MVDAQDDSDGTSRMATGRCFRRVSSIRPLRVKESLSYAPLSQSINCAGSNPAPRFTTTWSHPAGALAPSHRIDRLPVGPPTLYQLRILSLGAGVQSTCIFLMAVKGILPKPHLAIFADTGWETLATYQHLEWLEKIGNESGIPIIRVNNGNLREMLLERGPNRCTTPPLFIKITERTFDEEDGTWSDSGSRIGMGRRQCTRAFKLEPIRRKTRELLGLRPRQHAPQGAVEQWIGISLDELRRSRSYKPERMTDFRFPLIEWVKMDRQQCIQWIGNNFPGHVPPKSSCIGCPFHSNAEWRNLTEDEFRDACAVDEALRNARGLKNPAFLHRSCKPLADVDLTDYQARWFDPSDGKNSLILTGLSEI